MKRRFGQEYAICPPTYVLPEDYKKFLNDREQDSAKALYILKPAASSCGRGIKIIGKKALMDKKT
jgi:glutathionylspermidine synthase